MFKPVTCSLHHHIGEVTDFERGLNVASTRAIFEQHIEYFANTYNIIDLTTLLSGKLPSRPMLLTFDDTFQSTFDAIREVLVPRKLPCVFFMNSQLLDGDNCVSLDRALTYAANAIGVPKLCEALGAPLQPDVNGLVRNVMSQHGSRKRAEIKDFIFTKIANPGKARGAPLIKPQDLRWLADYRVELGNHTATHVHCRSLLPDELHEELVQSREELEALSGQRVRSFAMPYGSEKDLTPDVLLRLRKSGHQAIFLVGGRMNSLRKHRDVWYRVSLHFEEVENLPLEMTYLPLMRMLKDRFSK
jgi:peptidoglycan/xylan/chitin deacetylase (PgdA/CDA1 family)